METKCSKPPTSIRVRDKVTNCICHRLPVAGRSGYHRLRLISGRVTETLWETVDCPMNKWIHGAGIYANIGGILTGSMLPYIAYMDPMGVNKCQILRHTSA